MKPTSCRRLCAPHFVLSTVLLFVARGQTAELQQGPPATKLQEQSRERDRLVKQVEELRQAGKFDEAVPVAERVLGWERRTGGEASACVADALCMLADLQELRGKWHDALARRREALAVQEQALGKAPWRVADARLAVAFDEQVIRLSEADRSQTQAALRKEKEADRHLKEGKYHDADAAASQVLKCYQTVAGPESAEVARIWHLIGRSRLRRNDAHGAHQPNARALAIRRKLLPEEHPDIARSLNSLGVEQSQMGDPAAARISHEAALAIRRKTLPNDHPDIIQSLENLKDTLTDLGQYAAAKASIEEALAIHRKAIPPNLKGIAECLYDLGGVNVAQGEHGAAKRNYEEALSLYRQALPPDHPYTADCLNNLGIVQSDLRDYASAKASHLEALAIRRRAVAPDHPDIAVGLSNLGTVQRDLKDYPAAKASHEAALAIRRKVLPKDDPDIATSLYNLANVQRDLREFAAAKASYEEALGIYRKVQPPRNADIADSLYSLGMLHSDLREFTAAKASYEEALAIRRKIHPPSLAKIANALFELGYAEAELQDYAAAKKSHEEALKIRRQALPPDHPDIAASLNARGRVQTGLRELAAANTSYLESLTIFRKNFGNDHPDIAGVLSNLGDLQRELRDYGAARENLEQALAICVKLIPKGDVRIAKALTNLAILHHDVREFATSASRHQEALALFRAALPKDDPYIAASLNNLGEVQRDLQEFAAARKSLEEALAIYRRALPAGHPEIAICLVNLGLVQFQLEEHEEACKNCEEALAIYRGAFRAGDPRIAGSLICLGRVQKAEREFVAAKTTFEEALAIYRNARPEDQLEVAECLNALGSVQEHLGEYRAAERTHEEALAKYRAALPKDHPYIGVSLLELGSAQLSLGDYSAARRNEEEALSIFRKALPKDHPDIAGALLDLGKLGLVSGAGGHDAVAWLAEAADRLQADQLRRAAGQAEREQIASAIVAKDCLQFLIDATLTASTDPATAYNRVVRGKGAVTAAQSWAREARHDADTSRAPLVTRLRQVTREIAGLWLGGRLADPISDVHSVPALIRALSAERSRLERQLAESSPVYQSIQTRARIEAAGVRAALPEGTALVDLVDHLHVVTGKSGQAAPYYEHRMVAFVVRPGQTTVRAIPLGTSDRLADLIERWRASYGSGKTPPTGERDPGIELRKTLWEPLAQHLAGVKVVLISPDGALNGLPWAALPGSKPGTFLVHEYAFAVIPVPQLLPELLRGRTGGPIEPASLAVGNIDFDALGRADAGAKPENHFAALPGTMAEAAAVHNLFRAAFPGRPAALLTGKKATKEAFVKRAPGCSHLLVATHGFFLSEPVQSTPAGPGQLRSLDALLLRPELIGANPALRSGLVFAGANYESTGGENAFLTALEVGEMDLRRVDLAVLSACETGLGKVEGGEGVLGLQRAFQVAGARTAVTSLWKVPDAATQALMTRFHGNVWHKKMANAEALREAQLWLQQEGLRHPELALRSGLVRPGPKGNEGDAISPYYWAAFVLSGDWR
jgi:CHAT domain-containing protein/Tfp pilus assembly protein PilF